MLFSIMICSVITEDQHCRVLYTFITIITSLLKEIKQKNNQSFSTVVFFAFPVFSVSCAMPMSDRLSLSALVAAYQKFHCNSN